MMIPTLQMAQEPRLRRLFAIIGDALLDETFWDSEVTDELTDVMLDIAPEFLPPDDDDLMADWEAMIARARKGR